MHTKVHDGNDDVESISTTGDPYAALLKRVEALEAAKGKGAAEIDITGDGVVNEVDDALRTPYSMCVGLLLGNDASPFLRLAAAFLQSVLMFCQITLAFGFFDCSQLFAVRGDFPMYQTPIAMQNFYEPSGRWAGQPTITAVAGAIAAMVLALTFRSAAEGSIYSAYPIEYVLFLAEKPPTPLAAVQLLLGIVFVQFSWAIRTLLVPGLMSYGSVALWASENTATDIVKDSVVAAYLLDFDSMLYVLFPQGLRNQYEAKPGGAVAPGRGATTTIELTKWAVWACITWFMLDLLFGNWSIVGACSLFWWQGVKATQGVQCDGTTPLEGGGSEETFQAICLFLAAIYGVANSVMIWNSDGHDAGVYGALSKSIDSTPAKKALKAALILVSFGSMLAMAPLAEAVYDMYGGSWGYSWDSIAAAVPGTAFAHCLNSWGTSAFCSFTADLTGVSPPS